MANRSVGLYLGQRCCDIPLLSTHSGLRDHQPRVMLFSSRVVPYRRNSVKGRPSARAVALCVLTLVPTTAQAQYIRNPGVKRLADNLEGRASDVRTCQEDKHISIAAGADR